MIRAKENILANHTDYKPGQLIHGLSESQERQLVRSNSAEYVSEDATENAPVSASPQIAQPPKPALPDEPSMNWNKIKLLGQARKLGLTVEDTMTKQEILDVIKANPDAKPPKEDDAAEKKTPAVTRLPENAPTNVPQAPSQPGEGDDAQNH